MTAFEAEINVWMKEERPRIRHMCQSIRSGHILLSFVYEDAEELEQQGALQESVQNELSGMVGAFPRIFDDEVYVDEPLTNPRIPATPSPMNSTKEDTQ